MDLLTLIELCSVAKDVGLVLAMTLTFSGGNALTVKSTRAEVIAEGDLPATRDAAIAEFKRQLQAGGAPVAGLLPAPADWASMFERPMEDLLDPCAGVSIATAMVSQFEYECEQQNQGRKGRDCVLHKYERAVGLDFFATEVRDFIAEQQVPAPSVPIALDSEAMLQAAVLVTHVPGRSWGADMLLFPASSNPQAAPSAPSPAFSSAPALMPTPRVTPRARVLQKDAPLPAVPAVTERLNVAPLPSLSTVSRSTAMPLRVPAQH